MLILASKTFAREATGLVREASWFDVFMYNEAGMGFAGSSIMFAVWGFIYIGGDFWTLWAVSIACSIPILLTYYLLSASMPRTGADYIYSSRLLHPSVGVITAGFLGWAAPLANIGYAASGWVTAGLTPLLAYLSLTTGDANLGNIANYLTTPIPVFIIAALTTVVLALILSLTGIKRYFQIQNVLVGVSIFASFVMMAVALTTTHGQFVSAFNSIAAKYGTSYADILAKATQSGWTSPPETARQAIFLVPYILSGTWWASQSASFSGEIKKIKTSQLYGMLGSIFVFTAVFFVNYILVINMVGYDFAAAMGYFAFTNPAAVSVPVLLPFPGIFYYGLASNNTLLAVIISLGPICALLIMTGWCIMIFSRYLFAMSFDRVLPESISAISEKFHSPVKSVALATALSVVFLAVVEGLSQVSSAATYVYYVGASSNVLIQISAFIASLALALFPYLHKELYEQVFPFKRKLAGIPVATWTGIATMAVIVYSLDIWFLQPFSVLVYGGFPEVAYGCVVWAVILFVFYLAIKAYRSRQGIDLSLIFKEIPPE